MALSPSPPPIPNPHPHLTACAPHAPAVGPAASQHGHDTGRALVGQKAFGEDTQISTVLSPQGLWGHGDTHQTAAGHGVVALRVGRSGSGAGAQGCSGAGGGGLHGQQSDEGGVRTVGGKGTAGDMGIVGNDWHMGAMRGKRIWGQ